MKKFIKRVSLFGIILSVYMGGVFLVNLHYMNSENPALKWDDCKILAIGDSHLQLAINPQFLEFSKNISQPAEPYYISYWKVKKLLGINKNIDTVLLGFSYHNISACTDRLLINPNSAGDIFGRIYPIQELDDLKNVGIDKATYYKILVRKMCVYPYKSHTGYVGAYLAKTKSDVSNYESRIEKHFFIKKNLGEKNSGKEKTGKKNIGLSSVYLEYLNRIKNLCEEKHVKLILVTTPLYKEYLNRVPENIKDEYDRLKLKFTKEGVVVLDYSNAFSEDSDFFDCDHINKTGAEKFTKLIAKKLQSL